MLRKLILTTAATVLIATPLAAQAAQAAPARVSSPVAETEQLSQELLVLLGAAGFALLVLIFSDSGDGLPASP